MTSVAWSSTDVGIAPGPSWVCHEGEAHLLLDENLTGLRAIENAIH
jgi:hypothetical protein